MRVLVLCKACRRQYDASGLAAGSKFACSCGEAVTVELARGHDAAVVRCSGCGAPREKAGRACAHCNSDFTLRERDLHTVCPHCYARVSDRAKFCHHCAARINPESVAGEATSLRCPACDPAPLLFSRHIGGGANVLECGACAGFWVGVNTFDQLVAEAGKNAPPADDPGAMRLRRKASENVTAPSDWSYRACPVCDDLMPRRNFGRRSGVIIDLCGDHGVWLDVEELPRIMAWTRAGGLKTDPRREEMDRRTPNPFLTRSGAPRSTFNEEDLEHPVAWAVRKVIAAALRAARLYNNTDSFF